MDKRQAEKFLYYAGIATESESVGERQYPLPSAEVKSRTQRCLTVEEGAVTFQTYLSMMASLKPRQLALVVGFLDLIGYGESWMLETINDLLLEVMCSGPAKANESNPREVLADIAYNLFYWWDHIDTARSHVAQHPNLFPPPVAPEPPAPQVTRLHRKGAAVQPSARKARKKAAHA